MRTRQVTPLYADRPRPVGRTVDPSAWAEAGVPLLRSPRELVGDLYRVHRPQPGTAVVAVLEQNDRIVAGASFPARVGHGDGWQYRNALLLHLRHLVPHDLRLRSPVRTAVLLLCRHGGPDWTEEDGPWMWGLRDASGLHGLRCGAYVTLADTGWQVIGEQRAGRHPHAGSWSEETVRSLSSLSARGPDQPQRRMLEAPAPIVSPVPEPARIAAR
ncbi:hypothetical protein [Streptacidiphilus cavernicola]|uniref:Uncharacterized protein n=1 Tax=Streptacidiphilus cavernicola TaxID=3342716 RepID=A0ABV6W1J5_9ACTN